MKAKPSNSRAPALRRSVLSADAALQLSELDLGMGVLIGGRLV